MCGWMSRAECAMLMAVSCLSPVSTHTLMLAFSRAAIVSGTPSYNVSRHIEECLMLGRVNYRNYPNKSNLYDSK